MNSLHVLGARISPSTPVSNEDAAHHIRERMHVLIDLQNQSEAPLHVWSEMRAFDFDTETGVLTLDLAEPDQEPSPGIEIVSDHPRVPMQIIIEPEGTASIDVPVPTSIRRRTPSERLGMSFVEQPIENIHRVDLSVQYSDVPFQQIIEENPSQMRERLRAHGDVVRTTISTDHEEEG